jgi:CDP-diacylglycerol--glycerol-3-phosphate 3-phosphatidyltransferase
MANVLTAIRFLLVAPFAFFMYRGDERSAVLALAIWVAAVVTDLLDGPIARRQGTVTSLSGAFDHTSDFLLVTTGMLAGAFRRAFPWILPILITAAFLQYVVDSYWIHRERKLRGSKLGRYNGMLYFIPPLADTLIRLGAHLLQPVLVVLCWALVISTLLSMYHRLKAGMGSSKNLARRPAEK